MKGAGSSSEAMALWLIGAAKNWPTRVDGARETVPAESSIRSLTNLLRCRWVCKCDLSLLQAPDDFPKTFAAIGLALTKRILR